MWGFETYGVTPDIATLGKPMGNGHPLAAVVTTPEIATSFGVRLEYFNTFGGNPVSCAAGLAVLGVLEREGLQDNAERVGKYMSQIVNEMREDGMLISLDGPAANVLEIRPPLPFREEHADQLIASLTSQLEALT